MAESFAFDRPGDAVYFDLPLRHAFQAPVLGVPTRFESNSAGALRVLEEWFGSWRALVARPDLIAPRGVRVRVVVHEGGEGGAAPTPITCRIPDSDRVILHTPGSVAIADVPRRDGIAYVTTELLGDSWRMHAMVHGITLVLVNTCDRRPVHAALIARGRTALLLAAPAGTGKSTLAYWAHRRGLQVLTDDAAYVQVEPELRVWGLPGPLHLPPEARDSAPELAGRAPQLLANGTQKIVVDLPDQWPKPGAAPPVMTRCGVCLVERKGGPASLAPASMEEVQSFLIDGVGPSRAFHGDALDRAMAAVAAGGGWRLSLSENPEEALPFLESILAELERSA